MKICAKCGLTKPLSDFWPRRSNPDGVAHNCRACGTPKTKASNERRKQRIAADPEFAARVRAYGRDYRRRVKSEKYNVDVAAMEAEQGGRCAVCARTPDEVACSGVSGEVLHVDHDHRCCAGSSSCGKCVRGLLCKKCNSALALLDDDIARLAVLADYLRAHDAAKELS